MAGRGHQRSKRQKKEGAGKGREGMGKEAS